MQQLLAKGASVDAIVGECWTALFAAAEKGLDDIAQILIQHKADIHSKNNMAQTPLHVAARWGQGGVVKLLIQNGSEVCELDLN